MTTYDHEHKVPLLFGDGIPEVGEIIAGKYQVERVLGRGGMGVVVAALHTVLRQRVAVKFLLPSAQTLPDATERFLREAQSASQIRSEHVARVLDVGMLGNGVPYIVMEYLTGTDLGQLVKDCGPFPVAEAVDYVLQSCEALAEAHAQGIIHRDLKPANLFLTTRADGSSLVKVLDFGLSKVTSDGLAGPDHSLTATTAVMGSPFYMSPEQVRSLKRVDARTDIWSLGVILYQLLTGQTPFLGTSMSAIFASIAADQPASIRIYREDVSDALEKAILRCLEKDPMRRPQTISELARELSRFGTRSAALSVERISRILGDSRKDPEGSVVAGGTTEVISHDSPTSPVGSSQMSATTGMHNATTTVHHPPAVIGDVEQTRGPTTSSTGQTQAVESNHVTGSNSNPKPPMARASRSLRIAAAALVVVAAIASGLFLALGISRPSASHEVPKAVASETASATQADGTSSAPPIAPTLIVQPAMSTEPVPTSTISTVGQRTSAPAAPSKPLAPTTATGKPSKTKMMQKW